MDQEAQSEERIEKQKEIFLKIDKDILAETLTRVDEETKSKVVREMAEVYEERTGDSLLEA